MTLYKRKWDCGVCEGPVYYEDKTEMMVCACGAIEQKKGKIITLLNNVDFRVIA